MFDLVKGFIVIVSAIAAVLSLFVSFGPLADYVSTSGLLFYNGVGMAAVTALDSWFDDYDTKRGVVAYPFILLLAAALAHYMNV